MAKTLEFPVDTIFGKFFNDFLVGRNLHAIYASQCSKVIQERDKERYYLRGGIGLLIIVKDGYKIDSVRCEIRNNKTRIRLEKYLNRFLVLDLEHDGCVLYHFGENIRFFIFNCPEDERCCRSYQLKVVRS